MKNSMNGSKEQTKKTPKNSGISSTIRTVGLALILTLSAAACSTPVEKIQKQREKIHKLERELFVKSDHLEELAIQQNVQIDLEEKWAHPSINQEIWYSTNQIEKYREDIWKIKDELAEEQEKLFKLEEKYPDAARSRLKTERADINEASYIRQEYENTKKEYDKRRKTSKGK